MWKNEDERFFLLQVTLAFSSVSCYLRYEEGLVFQRNQFILCDFQDFILFAILVLCANSTYINASNTMIGLWKTWKIWNAPGIEYPLS